MLKTNIFGAIPVAQLNLIYAEVETKLFSENVDNGCLETCQV